MIHQLFSESLIMKISEQAWTVINEKWHPYDQYDTTTEAAGELREALRQLQSIRLPAAAIGWIGLAVAAAHRVALQSSWCAACGARGDETEKRSC